MTSVPTPESHLRSCYSELFVLAGELMSVTGSCSSSGEQARRYADEQLKECERRLLQAGLQKEVVEDAQKAVVALLDEAAQRLPDFRESWRSLQIDYFGHTELGHQFFERLRSLLKPGSSKIPPPVELLEVYERCLLLGFQGELASGRHEELRVTLEGLKNEIAGRAAREGGPPAIIPDFVESGKSKHGTRILSWWWPLLVALAAILLLWLRFQTQSHKKVSEVEKTTENVWQHIEGRIEGMDKKNDAPTEP